MTTAGGATTVIVPTRGRPDQVQACVEALLVGVAGAATPVEAIVVVDNNALPSAVRLPDDGQIVVRVLHEPRQGASRARNRGLAEATTDTVVFVDDDVWVERGWLDALLAPLADRAVAAAVGPISLACRPARPRWLTPALESWFSALDLGADTRPLTPLEHGWSANLAVRRSAIDVIHGFDPHLGPGTRSAFGDDADLLDRLRADGSVVVYAHDAWAHHQVGADRLRLRWLVRRGYRQGLTDVALQARDGHRDGRRPLRALRSVAGGLRWGLPALVRTARDPARRPGLAAEQLVIWSCKLGAARAYLSPAAALSPPGG